SGIPDCRNLAVRAFCRWQASCTICGVDEPLGAADLVVRTPAAGAGAAAVVAAVVAVWAAADRPATANAAAATLPDSISLRGMCICFMVVLLNLDVLTALSIRPWFSDRLQAGFPAS